MRRVVTAALLLAGCFISACSFLPKKPVDLEQTLATQASAIFSADNAQVILDNDSAFESKIALINSARHSIELAYFIFGDDYSSSHMAMALLDAAERGVKVRILVDYHQAYAQLDRYDMLRQFGRGNVDVRFYSRPSRNIIKDAAYLTLGCGESKKQDADCSAQKFADIERQFAAEQFGEQPASDYNFSNLDVAASGQFLAGLYGKNADLMAFAVQEGQGIDPQALRASSAAPDPKQAAQLKRIGKIWFRARYAGGFDGLKAKFEAAAAQAFFGEQIDPLYAAVTAHLPAERADNSAARRDWDYFSEFLHHKILMVDGRRLQFGGRNTEDAYHMNANELSDTYVFSDTDVVTDVDAQGATQLKAAFNKLWQFRSMVASLDEVRMHAPNDLLVNFDVHKAAVAACAERAGDDDCVAQHYAENFEPLAQRIQKHHQQMLARSKVYQTDYVPVPKPQRDATLAIDSGARLFYLENLPFKAGVRGYGSSDPEPGLHGKHIHQVWTDAMRRTCESASAEQPGRIIFYNAYFFLPANLLHALGSTLNGNWDCRHVTVTLITNSFQTTDLNVVNIVAGWQLKALTEYRDKLGALDKAAHLEYQEIQSQGAADKLSLHSKLMVFGDAVFIGSANADVRSFMLDSNNGAMIMDAPKFIADWQAWLAARHQRGLIRDQLAEISIPLAQLDQQSTQLLRELLEKYDRKGRVTPEKRAELEARTREVLGKVRTLSMGILEGKASAREEFNRLFKAI